MKYLLLLILFIAGMLAVFRPKVVWQITESWKSDDATDPSDLYILITRISGVLFLLLTGFALLVFIFA